MRRTPLVAVTGAAAAVLSLTACGAEDAPEQVTDVTWQLTAVGDVTLDLPSQARTSLAVGADTYTGAVGCHQFTGDVDWNTSGGSDTVTFTSQDARTEGDCLPGDRHYADLVTDLLGKSDLRWSFDDSGALRQFRLWVDGDAEHGMTFSG